MTYGSGLRLPFGSKPHYSNPMTIQKTTLKKTFYHLLEEEHHRNLWGRALDWFLIGLILANTVAVILASEPDIYTAYATYFQWFEWFSLSVFGIEFLARLWCITEKSPSKLAATTRLKWLRSPMAIIDMIAILPGILSLFGLDLRILRLLRLLRILKLSRYSVSLRILLRVLARESRSLQAILFILVILIIIAATGMYLVENAAQPDAFGSIPQAMWWAVVTLTTVGYGDVTPITPLGKLFGACITVLGIGIAALPAGILASGFANELAEQRNELELRFRTALISGEIDLNHRTKIETIRKEVGLSRQQAHIIIIDLIREKRLHEREQALRGKHENQCPRCGYKHDVTM